MQLILLPIVKQTFDDRLYEIVVENNSLTITSKKRDGRPSKPLVLPTKIDIDQNFIIGFGIFYSEGTWVIDGVSRVEAGNSEPILLDYFIYFLKKFGIKKNKLKVKIGVYEEDAIIKDPEELKSFWSRKLHIPIKNFQKVSFYQKVGSKRVATRFGIAQVRYYSTNLVRFMHSFKEYLLEVIRNDKNLTIDFLKGVIASEGHVELRDASSLKAVYIACKNTHEEISEILSKMGIRTTGYKEYNRCIRIQGIDNFKILHFNSMVAIHPDKNKAFAKGLKNHRYVLQVIPSRRIS